MSFLVVYMVIIDACEQNIQLYQNEIPFIEGWGSKFILWPQQLRKRGPFSCSGAFNHITWSSQQNEINCRLQDQEWTLNLNYSANVDKKSSKSSEKNGNLITFTSIETGKTHDMIKSSRIATKWILWWDCFLDIICFLKKTAVILTIKERSQELLSAENSIIVSVTIY